MKRNKINQAPNYKKKEIKVSTSDEWRTPRDFFDKVNAEFDLTVDRAATHENHLLESYFTKEGLFYKDEEPIDLDSLFAWWKGSGWINPPYSNPGAWLRKAHQELLGNNTLTVMLVKVATSENYWVETVKDAHVRFIAGRIKFWDENNQPHYGANFGSALVIFEPSSIGNPTTEYWNYREEKPYKLF